eukprot:PhF_6_TR12977/c0_g1_i1/m.20511
MSTLDIIVEEQQKARQRKAGTLSHQLIIARLCGSVRTRSGRIPTPDGVPTVPWPHDRPFTQPSQYPYSSLAEQHRLQPTVSTRPSSRHHVVVPLKKVRVPTIIKDSTSYLSADTQSLLNESSMLNNSTSQTSSPRKTKQTVTNKTSHKDTMTTQRTKRSGHLYRGMPPNTHTQTKSADPHDLALFVTPAPKVTSAIMYVRSAQDKACSRLASRILRAKTLGQVLETQKEGEDRDKLDISPSVYL